MPTASNMSAGEPSAATATRSLTSNGVNGPRHAGGDSAYSYRYERIPKDDASGALATAARRYRALRLAALTVSPESYSSTLAQEEAYPDEYWTGRLARRGFETFVCVAYPAANATGAGEPENKGGGGEYVAQVTFRGPCEYGPWELPVDSGQPVQRPEEWEPEERWQITGLYVHHQHRGKGLAAGVVGDAMEWVRIRDRNGDEEGSGGGRREEQGQKAPLQRVRFRTMIAPDNLASVALFRKMGFHDAGLCTQKEGVEANGEVLPEGWADDRAKWCTRGGWTMAKVVEL